MYKPNLAKIYHIEIILQWTRKLFSTQYVNPADVSMIFSRQQGRMKGNETLDWLRDAWFIIGLQNRLP